ncbi:MAG: SRPBCC family protein [Bryobacteraceae bacterium]
MKWVLIVLASVVGLVAITAVIGLMLPKEHTATRMLRLKQPPDKVWEAITAYEAMPSWRTGLASVERLPDRNGHAVWKEKVDGFEIPLEDIAVEPPRRLVRRIADSNLPFGGTWTYEITPTTEGSTIRITEDGFVNNPFFRVMSRFMDQAATMTGFLNALAAKFGEAPRIG